MHRSKRLLAVVVLAVLAIPTHAWAWGNKGHQVINIAAAQLMSSQGAAFFRSNASSLAQLSTVPDDAWKRANYQQERSLHFFQWDRYGTSTFSRSFDQYVYSQVVSQLGASYVQTNGGSIWRVDQIYAKLVTALKQQKWSNAMQMAAVLGHYVADLSQPMHDTSDYDGQSIGRQGVHFYFEITLVEPMDTSSLVQDAVNHGGQRRQTTDGAGGGSAGSPRVRELAVQEGMAAYEDLDNVLGEFHGRQQQDDNGLRGFFGPTMGNGAATLAQIWDMAVTESGASNFPGAVQVSEPQWFPLSDPTNNI